MGQQPEKIRVAVLYGGRSGEHEVSLLSAHNVIKYLDRSVFEVVPIGIDKKGVWFLGEDRETLKLNQDQEHMLFDPDLIGRPIMAASSLVKYTQSKDRIFDVVFPVIHGTYCEDGTVQGLLELAEVPYVGCGVLSSAIGMDKDISKRLVKGAGISVPPYLHIKQAEWEKSPKKIIEAINELMYPVFVKPANTGSSVGIEKIKNEKDLASAITNAFQYDTKVLIEKGINAIELEVAVLEARESGEDPIVSVVGEVTPNHEFYSYEAKYLDAEGASFNIPAKIDETLQNEVRDAAKMIFNALECEGMARVDLFLDRDTNKIYFNEINTIPGFTQISMYPKLMAASGVSYKDLLTHLVMLAISRHARKMKLIRDFTTS